MGHEASGRVAAVGDGVTSFSAGDRVTSIPKRPGQPQDLDAAVVFLAAESSRYVTGQTLLVDGGISTGATRALVQSAQGHAERPEKSS